MTTTFNLTARRHESRVLGSWLAARDGGAQRAGINAAASAESATSTGITAEQLMRVLGVSAASEAGVPVTAETAMRVSAVYGCVALIAGAIASLPLPIYERDGQTRRRAEHDYWWMLNEQAYSDMAAFTAWEYLISSKLLWGDGFAELLRPSIYSSRVIGWKPHHPLRVNPFRHEGELLYRVTDEDGRVRTLFAADMVHLPSLGFDGLTSPSPVTYAAREAIGIALAGQSYNARFFSQGATFDYALKTSNAKLSEDQLRALMASLQAKYAGHRSPMILVGGLEPAQLSVNPKDAEVLATRLFSVEEICRIFGVPPYLVSHTDKSTSWGSGIEQQGMSFVRYTLMRHLTPIAQELNRKLWPTRARFFVEHMAAALERGDLKTRFEAYRIAVGRAGEPGWMQPDEVRRIENMPPMEGGTTNTGAQDAQPTPPAAG